jgi:hypothetical protein
MDHDSQAHPATNIVMPGAPLAPFDPDGAHQLRIGLRRLRAALRALRPLVGRGSLRAFERSHETWADAWACYVMPTS